QIQRRPSGVDIRADTLGLLCVPARTGLPQLLLLSLPREASHTAGNAAAELHRAREQDVAEDGRQDRRCIRCTKDAHPVLPAWYHDLAVLQSFEHHERSAEQSHASCDRGREFFDCWDAVGTPRPSFL